MKRKLCKIMSVLIALTLLLPLGGAIAADAGEEFSSPRINVSIDGQLVNFTDQTPIIVNGRTLVPVRDVFETLGFDVDWDETARAAVLMNEDYHVVITIGMRMFMINGVMRTLDVPAQLIGGRTMLPIRAVLESVGYYVGWNGRTQTVIVRSEPFGSDCIYNQDVEFVVEYHRQCWGFVYSNRNLIVRSVEELLEVAENNIFTKLVYPDPNIKGYFLEVTNEFDDDFFTERMLVLITFTTSTGMASSRVDGVTVDKDNILNIHTTITIPDGPVTADIGIHFYIISVPFIEYVDIIPNPINLG